MFSTLWPIILVSLKVALLSTLLVTVFSIILALFLVIKPSKLMKAIEFFTYLPMALPPVALGYGLLLALGPKSFLGQTLHSYFGIDIAFTFTGAVLAAVTVSLGIGVRTIKGALERIDGLQSEIASLLGASFLKIVWHILLPQCFSAILGSALLVFIRSLSEFGATMVLAGNSFGDTRTLALAIWVGMETPGKERDVLLLVIIAVLISLMALMAAEIALRKSAK
jgi:molybdate transport system permease protein